MLHEEEHAGPQGIMDHIANLSAAGASGRLEIVAGGTEGGLLFRSGRLVDARLGHLTGFQAINALASMRDAQFYFDPSAAVPTFSSITPSERVVLKRFFGIETADSQDHSVPAPVSEPNIETASEPISEPIIASAETAAIYNTPRSFRYATVVVLGVLLIALAGAAVLLREKFRERRAADSVAANTETVSTPAAPEPRVDEPSPPTETARATETAHSTETARSTETPRSTETAPSAETARSTEAARSPETPRSTETAPSTPDLSGEWTIVNTVNTTSQRSFQNLRIGFALSINQTGTTFTAKGRKVSENGRTLPASSRTPIELKGSIKGDLIEATFSEHGALRKTNGRFVWKIDRAGSGLSGTFASTAARARGKSIATREL